MNKFTFCALLISLVLASAQLEDKVLLNEVALDDFSLSGKLDCIKAAPGLVGPLMTLVSDAKNKKGAQTLIADMQAVAQKIANLCDKCGIPKPTIHGNKVDVATCAADILGVAGIAAGVISDIKNPLKVIGSLKNFIQALPHTLGDCGINI
eukprot:CAMPEP_0176472848 /NCGR_PEP_ID=MMETSP0127-20121128/41978_1 /TAXON_ID=938130 /ORGANISM="Platyophrya macrostoma, Strain WH" /LENGTH=150 /DNA_ID=CAMNT_0017867777 /DNA_START=48 /DNA_END=500 /DNA_ORIENTATION=+